MYQGWPITEWHTHLCPSRQHGVLVMNRTKQTRRWCRSDYSQCISALLMSERLEQRQLLTAFVDAALAADSPFFAYMAPLAAHNPYTPAPRHFGQYNDVLPFHPPSFSIFLNPEHDRSMPTRLNPLICRDGGHSSRSLPWMNRFKTNIFT